MAVVPPIDPTLPWIHSNGCRRPFWIWQEDWDGTTTRDDRSANVFSRARSYRYRETRRPFVVVGSMGSSPSAAAGSFVFVSLKTIEFDEMGGPICGRRMAVSSSWWLTFYWNGPFPGDDWMVRCVPRNMKNVVAIVVPFRTGRMFPRAATSWLLRRRRIGRQILVDGPSYRSPNVWWDPNTNVGACRCLFCLFVWNGCLWHYRYFGSTDEWMDGCRTYCLWSSKVPLSL